MSAATGHPPPFPWRRVMHAGLCLLRLPPESFWAMSLPEFAAACGALGPDAGRLDAAGLAALLRAFPDQPAASLPTACEGPKP